MRHIYVIELDQAVLKLKRFNEANPLYRSGMPLVYVGLTSREPEQRFEQHKQGFKCSRLVKSYGIKLVRVQCEVIESPSYEVAQTREATKANELRKRGWGVWSN
jgi:predicted GIY-YIG superfamily endonuclease